MKILTNRPCILAVLFFGLLLSACTSSGIIAQSDFGKEVQAARLSDNYNTFREALRADPRIMLNGDFAYHRSTRNQNPCNRIRFTLNGSFFSLKSIESGSAISFNEIQKLNVRDAYAGFILHGNNAWNGIVEIVPVKNQPSAFN